MTERFNLNTTDFEDAWRMYLADAIKEHGYTDEWIANFRKLFFSGGAMAVGVLSNRLAQLPGTVEPGDMVKALINTIETSMAELEQKTGINHKGSA